MKKCQHYLNFMSNFRLCELATDFENPSRAITADPHRISFLATQGSHLDPDWTWVLQTGALQWHIAGTLPESPLALSAFRIDLRLLDLDWVMFVLYKSVKCSKVSLCLFCCLDSCPSGFPAVHAEQIVHWGSWALVKTIPCASKPFLLYNKPCLWGCTCHFFCVLSSIKSLCAGKFHVPFVATDI